MAGKTRLSLVRDKFMANMDDGRHIECVDLREMARSLYRAGVGVSEVEFEWHAGQRLVTAGQRVALLAELRFCASDRPGIGMVAAGQDAAAA